MQLPQQAIKDVTQKLSEAGCEIARYTHDLSSLESAALVAASANALAPVERMLDVGWVCKRCHMVYPREEACLRHRCMLESGTTATSATSASSASPLKLEQIQYACSECETTAATCCSTVAEFRRHLTEKHTDRSAEKTEEAVEDRETKMDWEHTLDRDCNAEIESTVGKGGTTEVESTEEKEGESVQILGEISIKVEKQNESVANTSLEIEKNEQLGDIKEEKDVVKEPVMVLTDSNYCSIANNQQPL